MKVTWGVVVFYQLAIWAPSSHSGYKPPQGWDKTAMKLQWSRAETDTVYKRSFKKGEVVVPLHSGTLGSHYGVPRMAFVKDGKVSRSGDK